jgi:hypothetical protein
MIRFTGFWLLVINFLSASSQVNHEFGIFIGGSNYHGDLVKYPTKWKETNFATGLFYSQNFNEHLGIRYAFNAGKISGADSNYHENHDRTKRNLSFFSPIYEANVQLVFCFRPFDPGNTDADLVLTPFVALGVGTFHFDPQANLNNKVFHLQPLPTELNKPNYSLYGFCIPVNAGFKITITEQVCLTLEYGFRKTFTDYLDDVSDKWANYGDVEASYGTEVALLTDRSRELSPANAYQKVNDPANLSNRGDPSHKDAYLFGGFSFSYCFEVYHRTGTPRVNLTRRRYRR